MQVSLGYVRYKQCTSGLFHQSFWVFGGDVGNFDDGEQGFKQCLAMVRTQLFQ